MTQKRWFIAKWSIPYQSLFRFGQGNEIFWYRPVPVYRFGITYIYIYNCEFKNTIKLISIIRVYIIY
jgi:hypothetical protein